MESKSLSVMQPYIFPYIGYFHLIEATDQIVFYDDVNFIKGGWINRNRILLNNSDFLFTVPITKASPNKLINEIKPKLDPFFIKKFLAQIEAAYKKAPNYNAVLEMLKAVLSKEYEDVSDLAINSITSVYDYLEKDIRWSKSSIESPESRGINRADRLVKISKDLGYEKYVNSIGGQELYSKPMFKENGIQLSFVKSHLVEYKQFGKEFVPWLSIIDILMFNDKKAVREQFTQFSLV